MIESHDVGFKPESEHETRQRDKSEEGLRYLERAITVTVLLSEICDIYLA